MKTIRLEGLGLDVVVWDAFFYYDDGFVDSVEWHQQLLDTIYNSILEPTQSTDEKDLYGIHLEFDGNKGDDIREKLVYAHIYVSDEVDRHLHKSYFKAFLETNLLIKIKSEKSLYDALEEKNIFIENLGLESKRVIMNIGAIFACEKEFPENYDNLFKQTVDRDLTRAGMLYKNGKNRLLN
ncbi:hypothetical protein ACFLTH_11040 [Bacteroidota bacterium]